MESDFCSLPLVSAWTLLTRWRRISGKKLFLLVARTPASLGPEAGSGGGSGSRTLIPGVSGQWSVVTVPLLCSEGCLYLYLCSGDHRLNVRVWRSLSVHKHVAMPTLAIMEHHGYLLLLFTVSNAIKRLHISSYGSLSMILFCTNIWKVTLSKIIYSKFLDILNGHIHMFIYSNRYN